MASRSQSETLILSLDGDQKESRIQLNRYLAEYSRLHLVEYTIIGAPNPNPNDYYSIYFTSNGPSIKTSVTNMEQESDRILLFIDKTSTQTLRSLNGSNGMGLLVEEGRHHGQLNSFNVKVYGSNGTQHDPVGNRLYDRIILRLNAFTTPVPKNPLYLTDTHLVNDSYNT